MASRIKEDEKNEKIIRGLLKLPANKRCINCNSLGPQYVCTNFWTFICTNCSGLHREFTHRVKSISMAKFTSQEVHALQGGGNERAREIYFKEWDPERHSFPDSSNVDRLRDFIKHVYVDRRYTGERSTDRPPMVKGEGDESNSYRSGSRSPPYEDNFEHRYGDRPNSGGRNDDRNFRYSNGGRSPASDPGDYGRSPGQFEAVNGGYQDDKYGNGNRNQRFGDRRSADGIPKPEGMSPDNQKGVGSSTAAIVPSVRDNISTSIPLPRIEPPKVGGVKVLDSSTKGNSSTSSTSIGSSGSNQGELKRVNSGSLIDFTADPEPLVTGTSHQPQQAASASASDQNWASFDVPIPEIAPQVVSSSSLESVLADLSAPGSIPTASNILNMPSSGINSSPATISGAHFPEGQQQLFSLFPATSGHTNNTPTNFPVMGIPNNERLLASSTGFAGQPTQTIVNPPQGSAVLSAQPTVEAKASGRKELPADLFAALYPATPTPVQTWQPGAHGGMGYGMQYPAAFNVPAFTHSSKSSNPFDSTNGPVSVSASQFPSMTSLHGVLPNMNNPSPLIRTSSVETPAPRWIPPLPHSYSSIASPSPYMAQPGQSMQQVPANVFQLANQGGQGAAFHPFGMDQLSAVRSSLPSTPNTFAPIGRNPFG
ncbi:probable ADP-ribosylation factor GTPase-activating protein AGD14 [Dioscorea cayenensis subsp. rotundata]|uniref:Probable ADP-ribosylation factor GTPase-activating protein AGD14 n=1 Tax=Dioscorea cayennensis subsp. rotundata TaxID=55577 RepID=A0AB40AUZ0_DIOCR|nr:probable ADP-ribosylation factor GTPase-activating protein AGD14 [Dioscorea cayenensis subsp. rotundata]XP_039118534.1 probable ADP-ribosylation factor GTPase-activating protein AGD14 [Dioscorea cayenensis subsp. rotundata]